MTLPTVQDILATWPGRAIVEPSYGDQSSGTGAGDTIVKELRDQTWALMAVSRVLPPNEIRYWKAKLMGLKNGQRLFYGYDTNAIWPTAYPCGTWPTGGAFNGLTAQVSAIADDALGIKLKLLPPGYAGMVGDMLSITYGDSDPAALSLLSVLEDFTASGGGITDFFTVEGPVPLDVAVGDLVAVKRPACLMKIDPGSISFPKDETSWGVISFKGVEEPNP